MNKQLILLALTFISLSTSLLAQDTIDILIQNAKIIDGTGNPWYIGDIAIHQNKIVAIGHVEVIANKTIDAKGLVAAPGFIDVHAHAEGNLTANPEAKNFLYDGVTSIITGNCGGSRVNIKSYFKEVSQKGVSINVGTLIGHNSIRKSIMGNEDRAPSPDELKSMQALVEQAMKDGAVGLSTGLIYLPGTFAKTDEIVALANIVQQYNGVYASHIRNEDYRVFEAIEEAVEIGKQAHVPVQVSHFKITGKTSWGRSDEMIEMIENYRKAGIDVTIDQYPYTASSTRLGVLMPSWAREGDILDLNKRLNDKTTKAKIIQEMKEVLQQMGFENYSYAYIANCTFNRALNGKNISEANAYFGRDTTLDNEIATIFQLLRKGIRVQMVYHKMNEEDVKRIMQYPFSMIARDSGVPAFGKNVPHPRTYGSCARVLGHYVREEKTIRLEDAIRKMTSLPAQRFQLKNRGVLAIGNIADVVLFDAEKIHSPATFEKPHAYSVGMRYVLVNGQLVIEDGLHNGTKAGVVISSSQ